MNTLFFGALVVILAVVGIESTVVFTGHADVDFASTNAFLTQRQKNTYFKFNDTTDLRRIDFLIERGRYPGMDIDAIHVIYDDLIDTLFVGLQCKGICGDTDGNGDPAATDPAGGGQLLLDNEDLCLEEFSIMFWNNVPMDYQVDPTDKKFFFPTMVIGNGDECLVDANGQHWLAYEWSLYKDCLWPRENIPTYYDENLDMEIDNNEPCVKQTKAKVNSPSDGYSNIILSEIWTEDASYREVPKPQLHTLYPNISNPHIEFKLANFSHYPQFENFVVGVTPFRLGVSAFSAALDFTGEDYLYPQVMTFYYDCSGFPGGDKDYDNCGVCGGDDSTCEDCFGEPNGVADYDHCGVCGGDNTTCDDCFGIPNGPAEYDRFGICGGDGEGDCFDDPYGNADYDNCGICGGDGSTCECIEYLGYDLSAVDYALLRWTISASLLKINDTLEILRSIKHNLPNYDYESGEIALHDYIDTLHNFCDHCLDNFDNAQMWFAEYISGACEGLECENPLNAQPGWTL